MRFVVLFFGLVGATLTAFVGFLLLFVETGIAFLRGNGIDKFFKDTADAETGHAFGHLDFLKEVGDPATGEPIGKTEKNLKAAVAGETYEYTQMYPGFAKQAREEGFAEVAEWFETLAKAEKSHAGRFAKGLQQVKAEG